MRPRPHGSHKVEWRRGGGRSIDPDVGPHDPSRRVR